ncbi:MAG: GntR family transcriptional regulator [Planctomycetota bacterium]|nr:GntR family transcriptional regulator [Planctomycetota bacterium]
MSRQGRGDFRRLAPRARVMQVLREWIGQGVLPRGQPIPSENALAQRLRVGRATVGRALTLLEQEGLVRQVTGRTRIVAPLPDTSNGLVRRTVVVLWPSVQLHIQPHHRGWGEAIVQGMIHEIREAGLHAMALHPDKVTDAEMEQLAREHPLGVAVPDVLTGPLTDPAWVSKVFDALGAARVPVAFYSDAPHLTGYDRVTSDHEAGSYALTRWLLDQRRRRILMLFDAPLSLYWCAGRRAGYERAMREAALEPLPTVEMAPCVFNASGDARQFDAHTRYTAGCLLEPVSSTNPPDALMLASDGEVYPAAAALRLLGKRPGQDVLLAGYDNYWAEVPWRPFETCGPQATVDKLNFESGQEMIRLLFARARGELPREPQRRVIPPRLVIVKD